jgi:hypothetical protein
MGDSYAIHALRRKRARLAGEILEAQKSLAKKRGTLTTLDAAIRLFEPTLNPTTITPIRPSRPCCVYFRHGEQMALALSALREAGKPITCNEVAEYAIGAKGLNPDHRVRAQIVENIRAALARLAVKGLTRKIVKWPDTWWELAS